MVQRAEGMSRMCPTCVPLPHPTPSLYLPWPIWGPLPLKRRPEEPGWWPPQAPAVRGKGAHLGPQGSGGPWSRRRPSGRSWAGYPLEGEPSSRCPSSRTSEPLEPLLLLLYSQSSSSIPRALTSSARASSSLLTHSTPCPKALSGESRGSVGKASLRRARWASSPSTRSQKGPSSRRRPRARPRGSWGPMGPV